MNWDDTFGQYIHANMVNQAIKQRPYIDKDKLNESIKRTSITVGITRDSIADVLQAEMELLAFMRVLGEKDITLDFLAGMLASIDFIRNGKHILDDNNCNHHE